MTTWLMDTPLFKMLKTAKAKPLLEWCEANEASVFVSVASLTHLARGISKSSASQSQHSTAQRIWLDEILTRFDDRIHPVNAAIALRAGELLPSFTTGHLHHRLHYALLIATAQIHDHGLVTRRDGIFGASTQIPIATV